MMETDNETTKPQEGAWDSLEGYSKKIKFEQDKPVVVIFPADFKGPVEMANTFGEGVFYLFEVLDGEGEKASITTSAWTLLRSLKTHEPLAGKTLVITKKNEKGKNYYHVMNDESYAKSKEIANK